MEPKISLDTAVKIIEACEAKAREIGRPVVITVLDESGIMVAQHRMDGSLLGSIMLSQKKAYTAVALAVPTDRAAAVCQPGAPMYGVQHTGEFVIFGGGLPIVSEGTLLGGLGVSGGSAEQDLAAAQAGLAVLRERCE